MNLKTRLLSVALAGVTIVSATGCSTQGRKVEQSSSISIESQQDEDSRLHSGVIEKENVQNIIPDLEDPISLGVSTNPIIEESIIEELTPELIFEQKLKERLYDENIDYKLVIDTYLNMDYEKRNILKDDYLRAIYMLMINSGISMETYQKELHTMMIMQQIPSCVPEDIWNTCFGNLIAISGNYPSLFEMFIDFATYVHELSCEEEHRTNEYYAYTCNNLEDELKLQLKLN